MRPTDCDLSIVIVTYNSRHVIEACLASLVAGVGTLSVEVIVVDNASTDSTREIVAHHPDVRLIRNARNLGFAKACNVGIDATRGSHVLLLNPDTIVTPDAFERLVAALEKFADVGLVGPTFLNPMGHAVRPALERAPSVGWLFSRLTPAKYFLRLRRKQPWRPPADTPTTAGYVLGACLLIRRSMLEQVGRLDEGYFLYWEDIEYSRRAIANGWKLLWTSTATVCHARAQSTERVDPGRRHWFSVIGARRYFQQTRRPVPFVVLWQLFKVLHLTGVVATWFESCVKTKAYTIAGRHARAQRHRQRWYEATAFLSDYWWSFLRL